MERREALSIGEILREAIEESCASRRYDEFTAINSWKKVMGDQLAARTLRPVINNGIMTVKVPSAPLRQELNMMRSTIAAAINREVGKDIITELRFI